MTRKAGAPFHIPTICIWIR